MSEHTVKLEINVNKLMFLGFSVLAHICLCLFLSRVTPQTDGDLDGNTHKAPLIVKIGDKNSRSKNTIHVKPQMPKAAPRAAHKPGPKKIHLSDLNATPALKPQLANRGETTKPTPARKTVEISRVAPPRPGQIPTAAPAALTGVRYGADELKKMSKDPMYQGGSEILTTDRVALNFELPEGKNPDELNESQMRLYGFIRRGAMKYVNSISAEIKQFELRNPHLQFPIVENKQILTGRLVYDNEGNLKQIKMVRWSNNDKLQGFFENVLKRLENLQNPPKELWVENGEFTVFVTLQING